MERNKDISLSLTLATLKLPLAALQSQKLLHFWYIVALFTGLKQFPIFFFYLVSILGYLVRLRLLKTSRRESQVFKLKQEFLDFDPTFLTVCL